MIIPIPYVSDQSYKKDPYIKGVRHNIAKMYWAMRRDGKKELAAFIFKKQLEATRHMYDLIAKTVIEGDPNINEWCKTTCEDGKLINEPFPGLFK